MTDFGLTFAQVTIKFLNMVTGKEYEETLEKVKFSGITWTHDNKVWKTVICELLKCERILSMCMF